MCVFIIVVTDTTFRDIIMDLEGRKYFLFFILLLLLVVSGSPLQAISANTQVLRLIPSLTRRDWIWPAERDSLYAQLLRPREERPKAHFSPKGLCILSQ